MPAAQMCGLLGLTLGLTGLAGLEKSGKLAALMAWVLAWVAAWVPLFEADFAA